ncbi:MAG: HTH-type transcriptional activator IlvY, partial [Spirochaetales bacterium]|nr:HTH-type transcriptional activator IlvY [Spirochaetales bacterium]
GQLPMVLSEQGLSRQRVDSWFQKKGLKPDVYAEVSGHEAILAMVRLGCGVGVVPRLVLEKSIFTAEIAVMDVTPRLQPYTVGLCLSAKRLASPLVRAFWEIVDTVA